MTDPLRLRVGQLYDSGVRRWPGQELILTSVGGVLLADCISPTPAQIDEFETADAHFAWADARHNGILCYRFGSARWQWIPFNPHRDTPPTKTAGLPAVAPGQHLALQVGLAEPDAPVLAIRTVEWPEHFVGAVRATVTRLGMQPFDAGRTVDESNSLYIYVGGERLARRAGVRCVSRVRPGPSPGRDANLRR